MNRHRAVEIVAMVNRMQRDEVAYYVDWVMDYAQGNTERKPSRTAEKICHLVDVAMGGE